MRRENDEEWQRLVGGMEARVLRRDRGRGVVVGKTFGRRIKQGAEKKRFDVGGGVY